MAKSNEYKPKLSDKPKIMFTYSLLLHSVFDDPIKAKCTEIAIQRLIKDYGFKRDMHPKTCWRMSCSITEDMTIHPKVKMDRPIFLSVMYEIFRSLKYNDSNFRHELCRLIVYMINHLHGVDRPEFKLNLSKNSIEYEEMDDVMLSYDESIEQMCPAVSWADQSDVLAKSGKVPSIKSESEFPSIKAPNRWVTSPMIQSPIPMISGSQSQVSTDIHKLMCYRVIRWDPDTLDDLSKKFSIMEFPNELGLSDNPREFDSVILSIYSKTRKSIEEVSALRRISHILGNGKVPFWDEQMKSKPA